MRVGDSFDVLNGQPRAGESGELPGSEIATPDLVRSETHAGQGIQERSTACHRCPSRTGGDRRGHVRAFLELWQDEGAMWLVIRVDRLSPSVRAFA